MEFTTNDVYRIMNTALMEQNYHMLDIEAKRKIVTGCFSNYFIYKLVQLSNNFGEDLEKLSIVELFSLIEGKIPEEKRMDVLSHPIRYLLLIISCLQDLEIVWEFNSEVNNASIVVNSSSKFDKLLTTSNPNMSACFDEVYQYFMKRLSVSSSSKYYNLSQYVSQ